MYCTYCGNEIDKEDTFCKKCGKLICSEENGKIAVDVEASQEKNKKAEKKKKPSKVILIVLAVVVCLVLALIFIFVKRPHKYNVEEYIVIKYEGLNGYGNAYVDFDRDRLVEDIEKGLYKEDSNSVQNIFNSERYDNNKKIYTHVNAIEIVLSKEQAIENGETITAEIKYDNEEITDLKFVFTGEKVETVVEGLANAIEVNPFDDLVVTFEGKSPEGKLNIEYIGDGNFVDENDFYYDKEEGFNNGEEIKICVDDSVENTINKGCVFTQTEKTYTVNGLDEYVQNYSDIPDDFIEKIKLETEDTIYAYSAKKYDEKYSLGDISYEAYILCVKQKGNEKDINNNELYCIYSGMLSNSEGKFDPYTVYFPVKYTNILMSNGSLSYEENKGIVGSSDLIYKNYSSETAGYNNPYMCYSELIDANRDNFVVTCAEEFEKFAKSEQISSLNDISQEYKEVLDDKVIDIIKSYTAKEYNSKIVLGELVKEGEYLLTLKEQGKNYYDNNRYIVVYGADISHKNGAFEKQKIYFPIEFRGMVKLPGDEFMYHECAGIQGRVTLVRMNHTDGYNDAEEMFSDLVTARREEYEYEVSEGLKQYGE